MWLTHFWHSWNQFFIFAWDVTAGGILRTGVLICLVQLNPVDLVKKYFLVICTALSQYRNQWWIINCDHENKLPYNLNKFAKSFFQEVHLNMASPKWPAFCSGLNAMLIQSHFLTVWHTWRIEIPDPRPWTSFIQVYTYWLSSNNTTNTFQNIQHKQW